jgi:hypothetical protein
VPPHWYGWCRLSHLRIGREYVNAMAPPAEAFKVPDTDLFKNMAPRPLRDSDFAHYPVRTISGSEMLAFAEWAGAHLPSEYEFERAGRGDRPNTEQHTVEGVWKKQNDRRRYAWVNNVACEWGPLAVDSEMVKGGDASFSGVRHLLGNVYELTRTFYDYHPKVSPAPPTPDPDLTNYALTAKGGCFGDRWQFLQLSVRTPKVGNAELDLKFNNRVDSLGLRLVRHPQPAYDLMLHSILRLSYDAGNAAWGSPLPHAYARKFIRGIEEVQFAKSGAPYIHAVKAAKAIAFAPLWMTDLTAAERTKSDGQWRNAGKMLSGRRYYLLGAFRSDVPLRVGRRLNPQAAAELLRDRKAYADAYRAWKQASKKKRENMKLPPKPPEPDRYELATQKQQKQVGMWREDTLPPGEWLVVYWYGHIGLANKALIMPPDAIIVVDKPRKNITRKREPAQPPQLRFDFEKDRASFVFQIEEQTGSGKKRQEPPQEENSELWAISEVLPNGWYGRKPGKYTWKFNLELQFEKGGLAKHKWNQTGRN